MNLEALRKAMLPLLHAGTEDNSSVLVIILLCSLLLVGQAVPTKLVMSEMWLKHTRAEIHYNKLGCLGVLRCLPNSFRVDALKILFCWLVNFCCLIHCAEIHMGEGGNIPLCLCDERGRRSGKGLQQDRAEELFQRVLLLHGLLGRSLASKCNTTFSVSITE